MTVREPQLRHDVVVLADGASVAVQEGGPADAPTLLLLAGQANSHDWWSGLRDAFETHFRTISFDYRGTGATVSDEGEWSTSLFADDARQVLDALGVSRAHVYGTSLGGRVAQMLSLDAPDRVDRLVLACTTPGGAIGHERSADVRRSLAQPDDRKRTQSLLRLMYTPTWFRPGRVSHLLGDPRMSSRAKVLHLRASARHDAGDRLAQVAAPTLVLHGDDDLMSPVENAYLLADLIPTSRVVITPGGRHGFFDEFEDEVANRVMEFLRE